MNSPGGTSSIGGQARLRISASAKGAARVIKRGWKWNPDVRTGDQLSLGERAADKMRNGMGSWAFVFAALVFLALWMGINGLIAHAHHRAFDPYPFILLNLVLSCVAALQGAILLIAAKRSDQISSELAQHDYEADVASHELLQTLTVNFSALAEQHDAMNRQVCTMLEMIQRLVAPEEPSEA
ncbi:DUF1003 domain-containing protein [Actinocrinis sp.]|uniref:DUF1003 domain-containing protein n=1 Tax=Actinocrinis sp. TaxID=1920516 RepID=UPI002C5CC381|nr:DUF1003 domain-containing protein [Actinocrinis sp.]HXR70235.1 DUF1003 domain-containing protein [Actinocrinis sp.]